MTARPVLKPSERHPISVTRTSGRVTVRVGGEVVAETSAALTLQEAEYPAVQYIPREDVNAQVLRSSDTTTYCPFKGDAGYFSIATPAGDVVEDAIWTYEQPYDAVAAIAGHLAFYPGKAEVSVTS